MKQSNPNWAKDLTTKLDELEGYEGKVGWFSNAKEEDGTPSAYVASVNEYGYPEGNIPPRLGLRETAAKKEVSWRTAAAAQAKKIMEGDAAPQSLVEMLVQICRRDFFKRINSNPPPPLKQATLDARKRKGIMHERTMVATGRMIEQLDSKVEKV